MVTNSRVIGEPSPCMKLVAAILFAMLVALPSSACREGEQSHPGGGDEAALPLSPAEISDIALRWITMEAGPSTRWITPLSKDEVHEVAPAAFEKAVALLGPVALLPISLEDAARLAATPIGDQGARSLYLLRGVEMEQADPPEYRVADQVRVFDLDDVVTVKVIGWRLNQHAFRPRPLIVALHGAPKKVFVEPRYSMTMTNEAMERSLRGGR